MYSLVHDVTKILNRSPYQGMLSRILSLRTETACKFMSFSIISVHITVSFQLSGLCDCDA